MTQTRHTPKYRVAGARATTLRLLLRLNLRGLNNRPHPEELEMVREQIESMDDITAVDDEVRGIVEQNWRAFAFKAAAAGGMTSPTAVALRKDGHNSERFICGKP
jgi:hypothetical protein